MSRRKTATAAPARKAEEPAEGRLIEVRRFRQEGLAITAARNGIVAAMFMPAENDREQPRAALYIPTGGERYSLIACMLTGNAEPPRAELVHLAGVRRFASSDPALCAAVARLPLADAQGQPQAPPAAPPADSAARAALVELPLDAIEFSPFQSLRRRGGMNPDSLGDLAASIRKHGVRVPLLVRKLADGRYELVAGERRLRAARIAGLRTVPCVLRELDDISAATDIALENLKRENLTPLEEGEAVAVLFARGLSAAEVGDRLGGSAAWAVRRRALAGLTKEWIDEANDEKSQVRHWSAAMLEQIARLPPDTQIELHRHGHLHEELDAPKNAEELRTALQPYTRVLAQAPFDLNDAILHPEAGACATCPKRSDRADLLFADLEEEAAPAPRARCLDALCWKAKVRLKGERARAALQAEHPKLIVVAEREDFGHQPNKDRWQAVYRMEEFGAAKPTDKAAFPAVVVDQPGEKVVWLAPRKYTTAAYRLGVQGKSGGRADKKPAAKPKAESLTPVAARKLLEERRAELQRRRTAWAIAEVQRLLDADWKDKAPSTAWVYGLVAALGLPWRLEICGHKALAPNGKECEAFEVAAEFAANPRALAEALWHGVRRVLCLRLRVPFPESLPTAAAEARRICEIVGKPGNKPSFDQLLAQAAEQLPEPKSFAQLAAVAGAKGSPAKKKDRKKAKPRKAAK